MARIAFVTWEGGGNVGPAIGLGQALRDRGHQVRFLGYEPQRQRLSAQGFALHTLKRSGDLDVGRADEALFARLLRDGWGKLLALVTTIAELDTAAANAEPNWRYVGPIVEKVAGGVPDVARERRDGVPLVLVSFSTTPFWEQRGRIDNTLAALADEPVRVLVSGIDAAELVLPANAEAHRFVPHAEVLPAASVVVTHCGHGTVTAALAHGLPIVGLPNPAADQPYLARRIADLGAGFELAGNAGPELIRDAVRRVLCEPSYAESARRLAASIAKAPGANGAAAEIERMAQEKASRATTGR